MVTDKPNVSIREYKEGDEQEINDLFNEIFHERRALEEWLWKYKKNPLGHVYLMTVAELDGHIVGQYANLPLLFKYKDRTVRVGFPVDNFVHPEFRGGIKGIQREMFEYQNVVAHNNDISFGFGFPNKEAYIVGKRILKYKDVGQIRVLFKRMSLHQALKRRFPWLPDSIIRCIQRIYALRLKLFITLRSKTNITIRKLSSFNEKFDSFWDMVKEQYEIIGVRDRRYLNWRYTKPGVDYDIYMAEKGTEVVGYVVTTVKKDESGTAGYIVDLLTKNKSEADSALIRRALLTFISKKTDYILCWMLADTEACDTLQRFGFFEREEFPPVKVVYFLFKGEEIDEVFLKEIKNWYLTMGDSDAF